MICLAPRVPGEIVGPRRLSGSAGRPLNFTVRGRNQIRHATKATRAKSQGKDPSFGTAGARAVRVQGPG